MSLRASYVDPIADPIAVAKCPVTVTSLRAGPLFSSSGRCSIHVCWLEEKKQGGEVP